MILDLLRDSRETIEKELPHLPRRRYFSPAFLCQYRVVSRLIRQYVKRGSTLDLGCGTMPFRSVVRRRGIAYHGMDLSPRSDDVACIGDIHRIPIVSGRSYDSVICLEVLEHIVNPPQALAEIYRVLKPEGVLIVSAPHLSRLHDEPRDYFRFTGYGLRHLLEQAGFEVLDIVQKGGLFSFLGHQISTLVLGLAWPVPGLRQTAWSLNRLLVTVPCCELDRIFRWSRLFALGYVAVGRKPSVRST